MGLMIALNAKRKLSSIIIKGRIYKIPEVRYTYSRDEFSI